MQKAFGNKYNIFYAIKYIAWTQYYAHDKQTSYFFLIIAKYYINHELLMHIFQEKTPQ